MDVTTVKVHKSTKNALDEVRKERESYDDVIGKLIALAKNKNLEKDLIEAYKSLGKDDLEVLEDWESASTEIKE